MLPDLETRVRLALAEDLGAGDVTSRATVAEASRCKARVAAKQDGILSGIHLFHFVFTLLHPETAVKQTNTAGHAFAKGDIITEFSGNTRAILAGERTALNLLQRLSGIATLTRAFVDKVEGTGCRICDTRKTTPLWRDVEKQAVLDGGGRNHRQGLHDALLIKENHVAAAGGIAPALRLAHEHRSHMHRIEIEVRTVAEFAEALTRKPDAILLDNMTLEQMRACVEQARGLGVILEASGNMSLERVRDVAETGVDFISVGALTHSPPACDLSLLLDAE